MSYAGDVDNDGIDDVIIGAVNDYNADSTVRPGNAYVIYGQQGAVGSLDPLGGSIALSQGFTYNNR